MHRTSSLIALLALAALFAWAAPSRAQMQDDYRFTGKVIDQAGKPIRDVQVTLHDPDAGTRIVFKTKEDGTFDRRMIPHGIYVASFEKSGYVTHTERFDWSEVGPATKEKIAQIVLENEAEKARQELGKKEAKLYEDAYSALNANDYATARQKADELLEMGAGNYEYAVRFVIARSEAMQGNLDSAKVEYGKVLALKPDLFEAHFDMGGILEKEGKHDEAIQQYEAAAQANPSDAESQYEIGAILMTAKKQYDASMPHLRKAVELNPNHSAATKALGLADLWAEKKDVPEGVAMLKKYLQLEPNAPDAAQIKEMIAAFEKEEQAPKQK